MDSPTTLWTTVQLSSGNPMDYTNDQQTGQGESDIVGDSANPGLYRYFDNNGTVNTMDGTMYFRVRLGQDENPGGFSNYLFIGILADSGDSIDLFVGVDGPKGRIKIWAPGNDLNVSPKTTSVTVPRNSQKIYATTAANYRWAPVNASLQPDLTNSNLDNGKANTQPIDYFLTFRVPFGDVASEMSRLVGLTITDKTTLRYVLATATQDNALNQDLGGVNNKSYNPSSTWTQLGATSTPAALDPGQPPPPPPGAEVPEPATVLLVAGGLSGILWSRRRR